MRRERQQPREIDSRCTTSCAGADVTSRHGHRIERGVLEAREHLGRCSTPIASAIQPRSETRPETTGIACPPGRGNKRGAPSVESLGDGGELEAQADAGTDHGQPVARREMIEPVAQRADRLRRVVAVRPLGSKRCAQVEPRCAMSVILVSMRYALTKMYHRGDAGGQLASRPAGMSGPRIVGDA